MYSGSVGVFSQTGNPDWIPQSATEEPITNFMGYRLIYLDPSHTHGTRVHLTDAATLRLTR